MNERKMTEAAMSFKVVINASFTFDTWGAPLEACWNLSFEILISCDVAQ